MKHSFSSKYELYSKSIATEAVFFFYNHLCVYEKDDTSLKNQNMFYQKENGNLILHAAIIMNP